ncbi:site-specific integrase [Lactobacillus sp. XV13L]|nr:site-specific integrase [Lactobacillus sp. XV13L]
MDDIDPLHGKINIDKTFNYRDGGFAPTKNPQSIRKIDIEKSFLKQLHPIIAEKKLKGQKLIFAKEIDNRPPSSNGVNKELISILKKLNIQKDITFHGLRHTHISYLLSNGVDVQYVSKRAGHSSVMTTLKIYTHILQKRERHEVKRTLELFTG